MNVGYTPERALDLAARLRVASAELEAARVVVERSRRSISAPSAAERRKLLAALDAYDRGREERRGRGRRAGSTVQARVR
jgi:hypothetical protein